MASQNGESRKERRTMSKVIDVQFEMSCPRCGGAMREVRVMNALSRRDNETYICSPCGTNEGLLDYARSGVSAAASRISMAKELNMWKRLPGKVAALYSPLRNAARLDALDGRGPDSSDTMPEVDHMMDHPELK
jgi:predicted RNA-binding Zn-ribbon protein involved in translation (DUF1610 family)